MTPENKVQPKILNPTKDKIENILNSDASLTINEIIQNVLSGYIPFSIQLTESETQFIKYLLEKQPFVITEIQTKILSIIRDNKIDTADIPDIIQLVKQLYILCHADKKQIRSTFLAGSNKKQKFAEIIGRIMKFLIRVILLKKTRATVYTNADDWQMEQDTAEKLLTSIDALINTCVELIIVSKQIKTKRFFSCCK
jgi:PHD/YefM family antitoxin component YafN of YafNO toxin-antitoxin module